MKKKKTENQPIWVEKELLNEVREHAGAKGHDIKWVATQAIRKYLDEQKTP